MSHIDRYYAESERLSTASLQPGTNRPWKNEFSRNVEEKRKGLRKTSSFLDAGVQASRTSRFLYFLANSASSAATPDQPRLQIVAPPGGLVQL